MAKEFGLGKGADILFGGASIQEEVQTQNTEPQNNAPKVDESFVEIEKLKPNPYQPRTDFTEESLNELAESIRLHGIIQPVVVEDAGDGTFYIIAGERRTRAAERAGLKKVPVILRKFSDERKLEVALIENIQRENLNPVEEARAYQRIMQMENISQEEAAKRVGKNRSTVANALRLLKLPEDMLNAVSAGSISSGHARALLSVVNPSDQRVLFARMMGTGMSVREAEALATEFNGGSRATTVTKKDKTTIKDPNIAYLEQQFLEILGTKVNIKGSLDRGTLQIDYFSKEDLDRLYEIMTRNG